MSGFRFTRAGWEVIEGLFQRSEYEDVWQRPRQIDYSYISSGRMSASLETIASRYRLYAFSVLLPSTK